MGDVSDPGDAKGEISSSHSASGPGIGSPLTAATSCASVQSSSWSGKPFQNGAIFRSSYPECQFGMYSEQFPLNLPSNA